MMRIAVLDDYQNVASTFADWSSLSGRAELTIFHDTVRHEDDLAKRLAVFDAVCLMRERTPFPASLIARLPRLKLIVTTGMNNASLDLAAAKARGILVCGTNSVGHSTAELAFAFVLQLARGISRESASLAEGGWQVGVGRDLAGARLGLLGLGRLGAKMAAYGRAFGMEVVAWSQNLTEEAASEKGAERVSREELFASSDFVSVHLRLSPRTTCIVGAAEFARMKRDAFLINTSRAGIIDQAALLNALQHQMIAGAALDVFDEEPLPEEHPLRHAPNLLMTPHIGYVTRDTYAVFYRETLEAVLGWLDGNPVRMIV